jgi:protein-S-isoprenylcysteine O-methyltransferase Ste14
MTRASLPASSVRPARTTLKTLVGSGDRIALSTLPFLVVGLILNVAYPSLFDVGGPPVILGVVSVAVLAAGVTIWAWSVVLILTHVPKGQLITHGPYAVVLHPLYTAVALLVLPWLGFLLDTWLGAALGVVTYTASRVFAPAEEKEMARTFGEAWTRYRRAVTVPWL